MFNRLQNRRSSFQSRRAYLQRFASINPNFKDQDPFSQEMLQHLIVSYLVDHHDVNDIWNNDKLIGLEGISKKSGKKWRIKLSWSGLNFKWTLEIPKSDMPIAQVGLKIKNIFDVGTLCQNIEMSLDEYLE
jgi:hypothetical protein